MALRQNLLVILLEEQADTKHDAIEPEPLSLAAWGVHQSRLLSTSEGNLTHSQTSDHGVNRRTPMRRRQLSRASDLADIQP